MSHFSDAANLYVPVFVILGATVGAAVGGQTADSPSSTVSTGFNRGEGRRADSNGIGADFAAAVREADAEAEGDDELHYKKCDRLR